MTLLESCVTSMSTQYLRLWVERRAWCVRLGTRLGVWDCSALGVISWSCVDSYLSSFLKHTTAGHAVVRVQMQSVAVLRLSSAVALPHFGHILLPQRVLQWCWERERERESRERETTCRERSILESTRERETKPGGYKVSHSRGSYWYPGQITGVVTMTTDHTNIFLSDSLTQTIPASDLRTLGIEILQGSVVDNV